MPTQTLHITEAKFLERMMDAVDATRRSPDLDIPSRKGNPKEALRCAKVWEVLPPGSGEVSVESPIPFAINLIAATGDSGTGLSLRQFQALKQAWEYYDVGQRAFIE